MSLRIGDKVIIMAQVYCNNKPDPKESRKGEVVDYKWNLVLIKFENGECDWIDRRNIHIKSNK